MVATVMGYHIWTSMVSM
uniref:Uncharacterized protein n=1 Tax=Anguilla anguilla TaxID=7936 RepID=A0A0E9PL42_ANGAN